MARTAASRAAWSSVKEGQTNAAAASNNTINTREQQRSEKKRASLTNRHGARKNKTKNVLLIICSCRSFDWAPGEPRHACPSTTLRGTPDTHSGQHLQPQNRLETVVYGLTMPQGWLAINPRANLWRWDPWVSPRTLRWGRTGLDRLVNHQQQKLQSGDDHLLDHPLGDLYDGNSSPMFPYVLH